MKTLAIDIETYSSVSLQKAGVYAYAASSDFEILLFGYAWDDGPVEVIDMAQGQKLPQELQDALYDPEILKTAFNASFERTCLSAFMGRVTPADQWSCTAVMARELGLPGSLEAVGEVIGLPEDKQKSKTGKALIRYFSIPCKATKVNGERTRNLPHHDPERWSLYVEYNRQDVVTERAIRKRLQKFPVIPSEHDLWIIDQHINDRGVGVDTVLAENAVAIDQIVKARLLDAAKELTGLDNPKSAAQLKSWIEEVSGFEVESLNKKMIGDVRSGTDNEEVHAMLDIRQGLAKTSTEKYNAMLRTVCPDGRIRGLTQFCGAARTGRWAGRLVQMQNLPQNKMPDSELDAARRLVREGDLETLEMLFDDTAGTLSQLIRTAFIPKPGCRFIVADFSAIEARVLAWLADEEWRMDVFNTHGKIYEASAEQMFHLPKGSVKKGDPMRQKGKIAELALGYGGSVGAMKSMGALAMGLEESELKPIVNSWRAANKSITKFWWDTDAAVRRCITTQAPVDLPHGMRLRKQGPLMRLRLPNGRELSYVKPRVDSDDNITYMISWMNASFGYKFRVDLEKNGDCIRVKVDSFHNWELASSIEGLNLQVVRISCADAFEDRAVEPLYSKNFYDLSRYGRSQAFTESLEEKQAACDKVIARYLASDRDTRTELQPSAALIRRLKQRKGFTNATRNNIRVYRSVAGYTIEMAGRNGAKAKSELIRLPGTK